MHASETWALEQVQQQKPQTPRITNPHAITERIALLEKKQRFQYSEGQKEALMRLDEMAACQSSLFGGHCESASKIFL